MARYGRYGVCFFAAEAVFPRADEVKARELWTFECLLKPDLCGNVKSTTSTLRGDFGGTNPGKKRQLFFMKDGPSDPVSFGQLCVVYHLLSWAR